MYLFAATQFCDWCWVMKIVVKCDYLEIWMQSELEQWPRCVYIKHNGGIGTFIGQTNKEWNSFTCSRYLQFFFHILYSSIKILSVWKTNPVISLFNKKYRNQFKKCSGFCSFLHCHEVCVKFKIRKWRTKDPLAVHLKFRHLKTCLIFDIAIHLMLRCSCFLTLRKV